MARSRVLLADDHPVIVEGVSSALKRHGVDIVASVNSPAEVLKTYAQSKPQVLVLDVRFGAGQTGLDVARELLQKHPAARIVFYSQFDQDEVIREAYRLGAAGFVTKDTLPEVLAAAISHAAAGKTYFLSAIAERLAILGLKGDDSPRAKLQPREIEVFVQLASGATNNEIADRMNLSSKTISTVVQSIKEKLGIQRAADFTRLAVRHGMMDP